MLCISIVYQVDKCVNLSFSTAMVVVELSQKATGIIWITNTDSLENAFLRIGANGAFQRSLRVIRTRTYKRLYFVQNLVYHHTKIPSTHLWTFCKPPQLATSKFSNINGKFKVDKPIWYQFLIKWPNSHFIVSTVFHKSYETGFCNSIYITESTVPKTMCSWGKSVIKHSYTSFAYLSHEHHSNWSGSW